MKRFTLFLCLALAAAPAGAILTRPDRDDAEYLELASRYGSSVALNAPEGEGVLIAPRWVLTAAPLARALQQMKPAARLEIGGRGHAIQSYFFQPEWKDGSHGIALLLLREPVKGIEPTPLYRGTDEANKGVVIVGHGGTGRIGDKSPAKTTDGRKKRAAINTVESTSPRTLELLIKAGDDASDLQGAATPGDAGGPAYIQAADGLFVAGIGYGTTDANGDGILGNAGDRETYGRVSSFVGWIEAVMTEVAAQDAARLMGDTDR